MVRQNKVSCNIPNPLINYATLFPLVVSTSTEICLLHHTKSAYSKHLTMLESQFIINRQLRFFEVRDWIDSTIKCRNLITHQNIVHLLHSPHLSIYNKYNKLPI